MIQDNNGADAGPKTGPDADSLDPMSQNHACARSPEADRIALDWLAGYNPRDGHGLIGETTEHHQFGRDIVLAAFAAGRAHQVEATAPTLFGAVLLLSEGARRFREYEKSHRAKAEGFRHAAAFAEPNRRENLSDDAFDSTNKAERNAEIAKRFEDYLLHDAVPRDKIALLALSLCQDLDALISDSDGVYGLHRNGDVAPWASLLVGGEFEEWLGSYEDLREALDGMFPPRDSHPGWPEPGDRVTVRHEGVDYVGVVEPGAAGEAAARAAGLPGPYARRTAPSYDVDGPIPREVAMVNAGTRPDDDQDADPAATVRTIEAAVAGGLIPGITEARLSGKRVEARLFPPGGFDPEVVEALRQTHDGA
jgi:hypothetical protein